MIAGELVNPAIVGFVTGLVGGGLASIMVQAIFKQRAPPYSPSREEDVDRSAPARPVLAQPSHQPLSQVEFARLMDGFLYQPSAAFEKHLERSFIANSNRFRKRRNTSPTAKTVSNPPEPQPEARDLPTGHQAETDEDAYSWATVSPSPEPIRIEPSEAVNWWTTHRDSSGVSSAAAFHATIESEGESVQVRDGTEWGLGEHILVLGDGDDLLAVPNFNSPCSKLAACFDVPARVARNALPENLIEPAILRAAPDGTVEVVNKGSVSS